MRRRDFLKALAVSTLPMPAIAQSAKPKTLRMCRACASVSGVASVARRMNARLAYWLNRVAATSISSDAWSLPNYKSSPALRRR